MHIKIPKEQVIMKIKLGVSLVFFVAMVSLNTHAAEKNRHIASSDALWSCTGDNIEGLAVSSGSGGKYSAGVSWDCFAGGGICERNVQAELIKPVAEGGSTIFRGQHFTLVLHTDAPAKKNGSVSAHISAIAPGPTDQGGGLSINENVYCTPGGN
jgi:hypothetical protein